MAKVTKLDWKIQVELTRAQVKSMAKLDNFVREFESMMKKEFASTNKNVDWSEVKALFQEFSRAAAEDRTFLDTLNTVLKESKK